MNSSHALPSDRSFGFLFVVVFAVLAAVGWWHDSAWAPWASLFSALTLAVTMLRPTALRPLNRQWMRLAELLNRFVSPVVLGVIYFGMLTPIAWVMRLAGRDPLLRRIEPSAPSYWILREPPGPDPKNLPNQY